MPATQTKPSNPYGKSRDVKNPYATYEAGGWTWKVLKLNVRPDKVASNQYASAFMAVSSPYTFGGHDMGDTYLRDIPRYAVLTQGVDVLKECGLR